ncbi:cobalt chelatase [Actinophytocola sp. NPDC049390]|uniref:cobaltochelatase CobT-related protein n=1 Tax=Actinophytocola sp. NPDC049390 TaxID=3363894 RepID=UPI00378E209D
MSRDLAAAAVRALSGYPDVRLRGGWPYRAGRPVPVSAPHLHAPPDRDDACARGAADGKALRLRHSDPALHAVLCPADPVRRLVFEQLEQFRVESHATLPGVVANLRHRFHAWSLAVRAESETAVLLFGVAQMCRARITGDPVLDEVEGVVESVRFALAPAIGDALLRLRRDRDDQAAFARHALAVADVVAALVPDRDLDGTPVDTAEGEESLTLVTGGGDGGGAPPVVAGAATRSDVDYHVFTAAYDRCDDAAALVRPAKARELRARLDRLIAARGVNLARLTAELARVLARQAHDGWDHGLDQGRIDGRALARLVTSPGERGLFRAERPAPAVPVLVTLLVDCSGSMGEHAEPVAVLVDVLARALERAGADCEVLGFTTAAWHGGRARRDWLRAGRPPHPGRLAEVRHVVFKAADTPWQRARPALAVLLHRELFREGVDGEAVRWAAERALARSTERRLLLVVSDGGPNERATVLANDQHYLDHHLVAVVSDVEHAGVRVRAVGLGHDLSAYYPHTHQHDTTSTGHGSLASVLDALSSP